MNSLLNTLNPLLRLAVIAGVAIAVKHHIRRGDDLDARDGKGLTPLMLAAGRKKASIVQLLLDSGANPALSDPEGKDALAYAERAGSKECVVSLSNALALLSPALENAKSDELTVPTSPAGHAGLPSLEALAGAALLKIETAKNTPHCPSSNSTPSLSQPLSVLSLDDAALDDIDDWEAEPEIVAPQGDEKIVAEARVLHTFIGQHLAVDSDEDWNDIDLFLPDRALPLAREDGEVGSVHNLLFRALREGAIPESALIDACRNIDESRNQDAESLLNFVIGDLGAVIECGPEIDGPPFFGEPLDEEALEIAEALAFAEDLASGRNDPLRIYLNLKEFRGDLLTAEEEVALSQEMEDCGSMALDALSRWPQGLTAVFDAAERVAKGEADVEAFSSGAELSEELETDIQNTSLEDVDEVEFDRDTALFISAVSHIRSLDRNEVVHIRAALSTVGLSRGFMLELAARAGDDPTGTLFASAVYRQAAARDRMICSNLRLAYSVAKKYQWSTEPLDDLVQEANIGLMKAVERFDWRRGFRFSTYAMWWIRQQIARAIADKARAIRIPVHMYESAQKLLRERAAFEARKGRPESEREISLRMGISRAKVGHLLSVLEEIASLDEQDSEAELPRVALLIDETSPDSAAVIEAISLKKRLIEMVNELDKRAARVIYLRFGLGEEDAMTLEEVGLRFDVTRERIRQIESKALGKLSRKMMWDVESFMDGVSIQRAVAKELSTPQPFLEA